MIYKCVVAESLDGQDALVVDPRYDSLRRKATHCKDIVEGSLSWAKQAECIIYDTLPADTVGPGSTRGWQADLTYRLFGKERLRLIVGQDAHEKTFGSVGNDGRVNYVAAIHAAP